MRYAITFAWMYLHVVAEVYFKCNFGLQEEVSQEVSKATTSFYEVRLAILVLCNPFDGFPYGRSPSAETHCRSGV